MPEVESNGPISFRGTVFTPSATDRTGELEKIQAPSTTIRTHLMDPKMISHDRSGSGRKAENGCATQSGRQEDRPPSPRCPRPEEPTRAEKRRPYEQQGKGRQAYSSLDRPTIPSGLVEKLVERGFDRGGSNGTREEGSVEPVAKSIPNQFVRGDSRMLRSMAIDNAAPEAPPERDRRGQSGQF